jgi:hypothetical protein
MVVESAAETSCIFLSEIMDNVRHDKLTGIIDQLLSQTEAFKEAF